MSPLVPFFSGVVVGGVIIGSVVSRALHRQLRGLLAAAGYEAALCRGFASALTRRPTRQPGFTPDGAAEESAA